MSEQVVSDKTQLSIFCISFPISRQLSQASAFLHCVSSLLRQFKIMYGKSIHDYYIEKKMELAKKLVLEENKTVKEIALMLGYNQASPFIEAFSKLYGYSPGSLKTYR
jgi:AraC-like DNA-binding protein